jgi:signal transduction histidine kinase
VVGNLVGNALKFTPAGGSVTLSARTGAMEVVFSVADTGPGIPPEHRSHLFDSFWQARSGDRRGVGLGLAITRGIVEAHGGRIWVESVPGAGSTFSFALPLAAAASRERRRAVDVTGITVGPRRTA